jgi:hypothetical protein
VAIMNGAAQLSRLGLRVLATAFGSLGIFCLHFSFVVLPDGRTRSSALAPPPRSP